MWGSDVVAVRILLALALLSAPSLPAAAAELFVSPSGTPAGDGTRASPWDLATALAQPARVRAGDTVWLLSGTYARPGARIARGEGCVFTSRLSGLPGQPITLRGAPGADPVIDGGEPGGDGAVPALCILGDDAIYRDFRVTSLSLSGRHGRDDPFPIDVARPRGIAIRGARVKLIGLVVDNCSAGVVAEAQSAELELCGSAIFHHGWLGDLDAMTGQALPPTLSHGRGFGVAIESAAGAPIKQLSDNLLSGPFALNVITAGSSPAELGAIHLQGNLLVDGASRIGAGLGARGGDGLVENSLFYRANLEIGVSGQGVDRLDDLTVRGNLLGRSGISVASWKRVLVEDNTVVHGSGVGCAVVDRGGAGPSPSPSPSPSGSPSPSPGVTPTWAWASNHYFGDCRYGTSGSFGGAALSFAAWQRATASERGSTSAAELPADEVRLRVTGCDPDRALLAIYNWSQAPSVRVDAAPLRAAGWSAGDRIVVHSALDYLGDAPVVVFDGEALVIDMRPERHRLGLPYGWDGGPLRPTSFPEFGGFLLARQARVEPPDAGATPDPDSGALDQGSLADAGLTEQADAGSSLPDVRTAPDSGQAPEVPGLAGSGCQCDEGSGSRPLELVFPGLAVLLLLRRARRPRP